MSFIKKSVKKLIPYSVSSHKAWEIKDNDLLKLDWNESTINPSPNVLQSLKLALNNQNLNRLKFGSLLLSNNRLQNWFATIY